MPILMCKADLRRAPWFTPRVGVLALMAGITLSAGVNARADLFGDDQARQAILDLRHRVDQVVLSQNKLIDDNAQLRRNLVNFQQQIDSLKDRLARERGQNELLIQQVSDLQKQQTDLLQRVAGPQPGAAASDAASGPGDDASSPQPQAGGGQNANPDAAAAPPVNPNPPPPQGKQDYDAALAQFQSGHFTAAQKGFANFIKRYPRSDLAPAALFWLGNAQYATRNYKEAISNFRSLLTVTPQHPKAPEALLSIANCQVELKDPKAARAALQQLIKTYPQSEAALAARDRLAKMK
jgi:tol-pal system protein YbgF